MQPARSDNYEAGIKLNEGSVRAELAAFYIRTTDELAVQQNFNGRTVEQNIAETNRRGLELAVDAALSGGFTARLAYTYLRAIVADPYTTCVGTPCQHAIVEAGSLPSGRSCGNSLYAGLHVGLLPTASLLGHAGDPRPCEDLRRRSQQGVCRGVLGIQRAGRLRSRNETLAIQRIRARLDNFTNRAYVGSVIVNESNSRYFEPAPGRVAYIMFTAAWRVD